MNAETINSDVTMYASPSSLLANRYRVICQLGQGGMGTVWLAEDLQLANRQVAIKMLPSILVSNKRAYDQLKAEALVSLKLTHPNIATVRAFEENGGNPFLVVDYIDGQTLDDYLAVKGKLSEKEVIGLLGPIASALDYAHGEGIVHRDVKPGNVMIRKDGHPFILDFGIAREVQETITHVTGKLSSGTLIYMSPEQLHGAAPNPSQDVYSFAAMAYECLMGTPPFSRGQIEYQIEHDTPVPLEQHFVKTGSGVMAGLAKCAEDRPLNCTAVLTVDGGRISAKSSWMTWNSKLESAGRLDSNNPLPGKSVMIRLHRSGWLRIVIVAIAIVSLVIGGIIWGLTYANNRHRDLALAAFEREEWKTALEESFKTDLNDLRLLYKISKCYLLGLGVGKDYVQAEKLARKGAARGCADAQNILGIMYRNGWGVSQDDTEAVAWFRKACDQGNPKAQYNLGLAYANGKGVERNDAEAELWLRKSAEQGNAGAQGWLGSMYQYGRGVQKNYWESAKWYRKAADQGCAPAQNSLGVMYHNGWGVTKDDAEAVVWYRKAAEQGEAFAQSNLGSMYLNGWGVTADDCEAAKWVRKSAEQGCAIAENLFGWLYENGRGVAKDFAEAEKWYRKGAEHGNADAQCRLGWVYLYGQGVVKDYAEAEKWFRRGAERGQAGAQHGLGVMYLNGLGVTKNAFDAVKWLKAAAEQGITNAQFILGGCYENGEGVVKDEREAVKWYHKAAEKGEVGAQLALGVCYETGKGVAKNQYEAAKWFIKAAENGEPASYGVVAFHYLEGNGVVRDVNEGLKWMRKAAEHGIVAAQSGLGIIYDEGKYVARDVNEATLWYRKAAAQGDKTAAQALKRLTGN